MADNKITNSKLSKTILSNINVSSNGIYYVYTPTNGTDPFSVLSSHGHTTTVSLSENYLIVGVGAPCSIASDRSTIALPTHAHKFSLNANGSIVIKNDLVLGSLPSYLGNCYIYPYLSSNNFGSPLTYNQNLNITLQVGNRTQVPFSQTFQMTFRLSCQTQDGEVVVIPTTAESTLNFNVILKG